jgi:hypothetical protein
LLGNRGFAFQQGLARIRWWGGAHCECESEEEGRKVNTGVLKSELLNKGKERGGECDKMEEQMYQSLSKYLK